MTTLNLDQVSTLEYKQLDTSHTAEYLALFNSNPNIMGIEKSKDFSVWKSEMLVSELSNPSTRVIGAFLDGRLIYSGLGYFPTNYFYWYSMSQMSALTPGSRSNVLVFIEIMKRLQSFAEEHGYFSYYARRTLRQQLVLDKIWRTFEAEKVVETRYDWYHECIYPANTPYTARNHQIFTAANEALKTVNVATTIALYTLRQQYREELLRAKHASLFT